MIGTAGQLSATVKTSAIPQSDIGLQFDSLASSLAKLLETARRELDCDREAAKASLVTASSLLQSEI